MRIRTVARTNSSILLLSCGAGQLICPPGIFHFAYPAVGDILISWKVSGFRPWAICILFAFARHLKMLAVFSDELFCGQYECQKVSPHPDQKWHLHWPSDKLMPFQNHKCAHFHIWLARFAGAANLIYGPLLIWQFPRRKANQEERPTMAAADIASAGNWEKGWHEAAGLGDAIIGGPGLALGNGNWGSGIGDWESFQLSPWPSWHCSVDWQQSCPAQRKNVTKCGNQFKWFTLRSRYFRYKFQISGWL